MKKNKSLKMDASIYLVSTIVAKSVGILSLPIYTRFLSLDEYGLYSLFGVFSTTAAGFISVGLMHSTYRYYFELKNDKDDNFRILNFSNLSFLLFVFFLGTIIFYFFSDIIINTFFKSKIKTSLLIFSFISGALTYLLDYNLLLFTALKRSITYAIFTICRPILMLSLSVIFFYFFESNINAIIVGQLFAISFLLVPSYICLLDQFKIGFSLKYLKISLSYSYPLLPRSIIGQIYNSFDKVMLTNYSGFSGVGLYSLSNKYSEVMKLIMASFDKVWHPYFLDNATSGTNGNKQKIINKFEELSFIIIFIGLIIIFFGHEVINILVRDEFRKAAIYIPIYMYYYIFSIIGMMGYMQITYAKKMKYLFFGAFGAIITNILFNLILIPFYGVMGACIATVIAALVGAIFNAYNGQKVYKLPINFYKLIGLIALSIIFNIVPFITSITNLEFSISIIVLKVIIIFFFIITSIYLGFTSKKIMLSYVNWFISYIKR